MSVTASGPDVAEAAVVTRWWGYSGSGLRGSSMLVVAEFAAVGLALVVLAVLVTPARGGRDVERMAYGLASLVPALALTRPWRHVPMVELWAAATVAVTSLLVPFLAPSGWSDALRPAAWAYAAVIMVVARGFARDAQRRAALGAAVVLVAMDAFSRAWLPWWGGRDPAIPMIGSFYWHNPFAAYVLVGAIIGVAVVVLSPWSRGSLIGWLAAPLCVAGVVLSTSRATMLLLAASALLLVLVGAARVGRRAVVRGVAVCVLSFALLVLVTSSLVFPNAPGTPLGGAERRSAAGEGVSRNSAFRVEFWEAAVRVWRDYPVTGAGYDTFASASAHYLDPGAVRSPAAHNGVLQELADGGLVHGLPIAAGFTAALLALAAIIVRALRATVDASPAALGAAVATGAVFGHAFLDFDWMYPSCLAITGLVLGLGLSGRAAVRPPQTSADAPRSTARGVAARGAVALIVLTAGLSGLALVESRRVDREIRVAENASRRDKPRAARLAADIRPRLGDPRPWVAVLDYSIALGSDRPLPLPPATVRQAVRETERLAQVDPGVAAQRALARYVLGDRVAATRAMAALVDQEYQFRPGLTVPLARLLAEDGDDKAAAAALLRTIRFHVNARNSLVAGPVWGLVRELDRLPGTVSLYRCTYASVAHAFGPPGARLKVRPAGPVPVSSSCEDFSGR